MISIHGVLWIYGNHLHEKELLKLQLDGVELFFKGVEKYSKTMKVRSTDCLSLNLLGRENL